MIDLRKLFNGKIASINGILQTEWNKIYDEMQNRLVVAGSCGSIIKTQYWFGGQLGFFSLVASL